MNGSIFEVVVIGAGHAGLSTSYFLKHLGLDHIIFEQGKIAASWLGVHNSNVTLITPQRFLELQGANPRKRSMDDLPGAHAYANQLKEYASAYQLPVTEGSRVISVEKKSGSPVFTITVEQENEAVRTYDCWQVVVAAGARMKTIPSLSEKVPVDIMQLHSSEFTDVTNLPDGDVLIVGGGQSGCEVANALADGSRSVYLSTAGTFSLPRTYRGKDMVEWLIIMKRFMDASFNLPVLSCNTQENFLSLGLLASKGVRIVGALRDLNSQAFFFANDIGEIAKMERDFMITVLREIDQYIVENKLDVPLETIVPDSPLKQPEIADLPSENITSIVWATGYQPDYSFIHLPIFSSEGVLLQKDGITSVEGLYFVGLPRQRNYNSPLAVGTREDASFIANRIYGVLR